MNKMVKIMGRKEPGAGKPHRGARRAASRKARAKMKDWLERVEAAVDAGDPELAIRIFNNR